MSSAMRVLQRGRLPLVEGRGQLVGQRAQGHRRVPRRRARRRPTRGPPLAPPRGRSPVAARSGTSSPRAATCGSASVARRGLVPPVPRPPARHAASRARRRPAAPWPHRGASANPCSRAARAAWAAARRCAVSCVAERGRGAARLLWPRRGRRRRRPVLRRRRSRRASRAAAISSWAASPMVAQRGLIAASAQRAARRRRSPSGGQSWSRSSVELARHAPRGRAPARPRPRRGSGGSAASASRRRGLVGGRRLRRRPRAGSGSRTTTSRLGSKRTRARRGAGPPRRAAERWSSSVTACGVGRAGAGCSVAPHTWQGSPSAS